MHFKIGDKVRIVAIVEEERGWGNEWSHEVMDKFVGNGMVYEVAGIGYMGVRLCEIGMTLDVPNWRYDVDDARRFGWPHGALELHSGLFVDGGGHEI